MGFLDEIGTIPLSVQEKILRVVEYGSFERVGGSNPVEVDVRIVGATNVDLSAMAERDEFKRDLLDRLSFEVLFLPPLRSRREDIMLLAEHFSTRMAFELGYEEMPVFTRKAIGLLERYPWTGNIRELKNVVERAVYQCGQGRIDQVIFDPFVSPYPFDAMEGGREIDTGDSSAPAGTRSPLDEADLLSLPFKESIRNHELNLVRAALEAARYNQRKAAELLQLSYDQFRGLYKKYREELDCA